MSLLPVFQVLRAVPVRVSQLVRELLRQEELAVEALASVGVVGDMASSVMVAFAEDTPSAVAVDIGEHREMAVAFQVEIQRILEGTTDRRVDSPALALASALVVASVAGRRQQVALAWRQLARSWQPLSLSCLYRHLPHA